MPEFAPGDIVRLPNFPESRYTVVAGPDSRGCYALTNTGGEFVLRGSSSVVLVEGAPGDESDELNMLLERIVKLEALLHDHTTIIGRQAAIVSKLTDRLDRALTDQARAETRLNKLMAWKES